jgi:soluble lytic murein transglycosylase
MLALAVIAGGTLAASLTAGTAPSAAAESRKAAAAPKISTAAAEATAAIDPAKPGDDETTPAQREAAYSAKLDAMVAPLLTYKLSEADGVNIRKAIHELYAHHTDKAAELAAKIGDPLGRKLVTWYRLRQGFGDAAEFRAFLEQNPDWPSAEVLRRRMEEVLFLEGGNTDLLVSYFKDGKPQSAAGMAVLASVHLAHGEKDKAREIAAKVWREEDLAAKLEKGFLARFGPLLTEADHKWRLDRLLIDDIRYRAGRNERAAMAKRVIPLLSKAEQRKARARLAVFLHHKAPKSKLQAATGAKSTDWGLVFHKIQQLRRADKLDEAAKLMLSAPRDPDVVVNLDDWWNERQTLAYMALKSDKPKLAYKLVSEAGPLSVNPLNEQRFMAGWVALRYLKDYATAARHFTDYTKSADGPLSRAKANYWLGRAYEAQEQTSKADAAYRKAASEMDTFHGLLAMQKLHPGQHRLRIDPPAMPTAAQVERLRRMEPARAVALAQEAKLSSFIPRIMLQHMATLEDSESWEALVAHLARASGDTQASVRIGKAAIAKGHDLLYYSYPVHALPKYKPLRPPPETAFLLGIARQETEFNTSIVSGAGARGILQIMKGTATHVCRTYRIKCHHDKLVKDPAYNTMLASAYIGDRMQEFSGSYILGLTSYNAGPGRTRQWIREFGDPRKSSVDPLDWIERIPIEETRRYVVKVLSNIQIYRARLGQEANALRLDHDLNRAREAQAPLPRRKGTATAATDN